MMRITLNYLQKPGLKMVSMIFLLGPLLQLDYPMTLFVGIMILPGMFIMKTFTHTDLTFLQIIKSMILFHPYLDGLVVGINILSHIMDSICQMIIKDWLHFLIGMEIISMIRKMAITLTLDFHQ